MLFTLGLRFCMAAFILCTRLRFADLIEDHRNHRGRYFNHAKKTQQRTSSSTLTQIQTRASCRPLPNPTHLEIPD